MWIKLNDTNVQREDGVVINTNLPGIIENRDYQEYVAWREAGNVAHLAAPTPPSRDDLIAYAADKRWRIEIGGCIVDGRPIATDRESQSKLLAEMVAIGAGLRADPSPWKCADGTFASLTSAGMLAVIAGARAHVAGAFAVEAAVVAGIASGTITTTAQIDSAGWSA